MYIYLFINFIIGFISDIILNILAHKFPKTTLGTLLPYFKNKTIIQAGVYAGLTVLIVVSIISIISKQLFDFYVPNNIKQLFKYCIITFIISYIGDIIIEKLHIFGNSLDLYYNTLGSGLWGALAILFSVIVSYFIIHFFL